MFVGSDSGGPAGIRNPRICVSMTPTPIVLWPPPIRTIAGTLSQTEPVLRVSGQETVAT